MRLALSERLAASKPNPGLSLVGLGLTNVTATVVNLELILLALHSSAPIAAVIVFLRLVPALLFPLLMGHLADMWDRRSILFMSSLLGTLAPLMLFWVAAGSPDLLLEVGVVCILQGVADGGWSAIAGPAAYERSTRLEQRMRLSVRMGYGWDVGKLLGAAAIVISGPVGLLVAVATQLGAAVAALRLSAKIVGDVEIAVARVPIRRILFPGTLLMIAGVTFASFFGMDYNLLASVAASGSRSTAGLLMMFFAAGALCGTGLLELRWPPRLIHLQVGGALLALMTLLLGTGKVPFLILPFLGIGAALCWQSWRALAVARMPAEAQGRWSGGAFSVQRAGMALGSPVLAFVVLLGYRSLVLFVAGAVTGLGAILWSLGTHRYIRSLEASPGLPLGSAHVEEGRAPVDSAATAEW